MALERRRVQYAGHVQGVGFRFTAQRIAQGFSVAGYVRNLPDGRVEILVEGVTSEIDSFLEAVRAALDDKIRSVTEAIEPRDETVYSEFLIRH